jgi:hypothetical protein
MRTWGIRTVTLLALLAYCNGAVGQPPAPDKDTGPKGKSPATQKKEAPLGLEELLSRALKENPDIRVAEAKTREAEAELNRVRMLVMQKVVKAHQEVLVRRAAVKTAEDRLKRLKTLSGAVSREEIQAAEEQLLQAKAVLAQAETELPYLLGNVPHAVTIKAVAFSPDGRILATETHQGIVRLWDIATGQELKDVAGGVRVWDLQPVHGNMAEKLRKALDTQITVDFKNKPPAVALKKLQEHLKGVNFINMSGSIYEGTLDMKLDEPVPLGAALQMFEDQTGVRFYVREYGLVVAPANQVPKGALYLHDFWKSKPDKGPSAEKKQ